MSCIFCLIRDGQIPSTKIYEDDDILAILDISQATKGHTLVFPKIHSNNLLSISEYQFNKVLTKVHMLAPKIVEAMNADGCNILNNCNEVAGQTIMHFHIHIIPRYKGDDVSIQLGEHKEDLLAIAKKIKAKL